MAKNIIPSLPDYIGDRSKRDWTNITRPVAVDILYQKTRNNSHRIQFYDDNAEYYDEDNVDAHGFQGPRYVAITLHKYLDGNENAEILDVGCGTGLVSAELRKLGTYPNVTGLDPSEGMLEQANKLNRFKKTLHQFFKPGTDLPENTYDGITSSASFCPGHMHPEVVSEMCRILKPGGIMVLGLRSDYMETDPELIQLPTYLQKLEDDGLCRKLERSICPQHFTKLEGTVFAYQKL